MATQWVAWLRGAPAISSIIFWSLGESDSPRMWSGQWQRRGKGLGIWTGKVTWGHTQRDQGSDPANLLTPFLTLGRLLSSWTLVSPSVRKELFLRSAHLCRRTRKNRSFFLGFVHWAFISPGWRRTMRLQKGSASLAVPSTCITWTSARRMTPSPSTLPALERWVQLHQTFSFSSLLLSNLCTVPNHVLNHLIFFFRLPK